MTARAYCFTEFKQLDYEPILTRAKEDPQCNFIIVQKERSPTTDAEHLQGYIQFSSPQRMARVKRIVSKSTHIERSKGSSQQNVEYCSKEQTRLEGPWQWGQVTSQGMRRDLKTLVEQVQQNKSNLEIYEENPVGFVKWKKYIGHARNMELAKRSAKFRTVETIVLYGDAGTGKTRYAMEREKSIYIVPDPEGNRVWFDGYEGQEAILIDDFYGWIKYHYLLRILDGYQIRLQTKGGFVHGCWNRVYITSNKHPREWYKIGFTAALKRRITKCIHFDADHPFQCHEVTGGNTIPCDKMAGKTNSEGSIFKK